MAAVSGGKGGPIWFNMKLNVSLASGETSPEMCSIVMKCIQESMPNIESILKEDQTLSYVHIRNAFLTNEGELHLRYIVNNEEELFNFFLYSEKLSAWLTKFVKGKKIADIQVGVSMTFDEYSDMLTNYFPRNFGTPQSCTGTNVASSVERDNKILPTTGNLIIVHEDEPLVKNVVKKMFKVHVPYPDYSIIEVNLRCATSKSLDKTRLAKENHGIFYVELEMPASGEQNLSYSYEVTLKGMFRNYQKTSNSHEMTSSQEQLSMWKRTGDIFVNGIVAHALNIIARSGEECLKSSAIEMENLVCAASSLSMKEYHNILKSVLAYLEQIGDISQVLITVLIGKLFPKIPDKLESITLDQARNVLRALRKVHISQFPESSTKYMSAVCSTLTRTVLGKDFSLLRHMALVYPFFDVETLKKSIDDCVRKKDCLCNDDLESTTDATHLINAVWMHRLNSKEKPMHLHIFISNIIRYFPISIAVQVYQDANGLIASQSSDWNGMSFTEPMFIRCVEEIKSSKRVGILQILKLWNALQAVACRQDEIKTLIEKEIIDILKQGRYENWKNILDRICRTTELFEIETTKFELLYAIANSQSYCIHGLMKFVLEQEKFQVVPQDAIRPLLEAWLRNMILMHLPRCATFHAAISSLYNAYFFAEKRTNMFDEDLSCFDVLVMNYLKSQGLKKVLHTMGPIEEACTSPADLHACKKHLQALVKDANTSLKAEDVLNILYFTGEVRINSRLVYFVIQLIVDLFKPSSNQDTVENFVRMVHEVKFWKRVFHASGKYKEEFHETASFRAGMFCVNSMADLLESHCISFRQLLRIASLPGIDVKEMLYCGKREKLMIDGLLIDTERILEKVQTNVNVVFDVLSTMKCCIQNEFLENIVQFIAEIEGIHQNFNNISLTEYTSHEGIWSEIDHLAQPCKRLSRVIQSKVFWNVNSKYKCSDGDGEVIEIEYETDENKCIQDIRYLFETEKWPCYINVYKFLEYGSKQYSKAWQLLLTDTSVGMQTVRNMFIGATYKMDCEIEIAEAHLGIKLPSKCQSTLMRLANSVESREFVDAIDKSAKVFKLQLSDYDKFKEAVDSFYRFLEDDCRTLTFDEASSCLQIVFDIERRLSNTTIHILNYVGKASSLLEFLQSIAEDDIRNLIDAVEDISEQHVDESTVSSLIDVQRFFKPLFQPHLELKITSMFEAVQRQTDVLGKAAEDLPFKIDDCMRNLHNLKSLYNNVANRGEQTKQIIKNIVRKGTVHFQLCPDEKTCDFKVTYKQDKKQHTTQTKSAIHDYRSRALLLMNSEKQKHETKHLKVDLEKFISFVDVCNEISNIIYELHVCGHVDFKVYGTNSTLVQLEELKFKLDYMLKTWQEDLERNRKQFYLMNFFQGKHIHALDNFFEKNCDDQVVKALLQLIHPSINLEDLKILYHTLKLENASIDQLHLIGKTFHKCFENLSRFQRAISLNQEQTIHVTEIIQDGRMLFARLDEDSTQLIRCVLALFLKTTGALPEPNQILLCSRETTWDEIMLILYRCLGAYEFYGESILFCITNIELLSSEVQSKLIEELKGLPDGNHFWLAVICNCRPNHHLVDEFSDNIVSIRSLSDEALREIFHNECPSVFTYTSDVAGLGKTSAISKLAQSYGRQLKVLHISGPIQNRHIVSRLNSLRLQQDQFLHIEIGDVDNPAQLDKIIFELIILRFIDAGFMSVSMPTEFVAIEIGNTINDNLRNALTTAVSFRREHLEWKKFNDFTVSMEVNSPVQVVCQYLTALDKGLLDKQDLYFTGKNKVSALSPSECRHILRSFFITDNDTSYATVNTCLNVLADQLKKMSVSAFFRTARISDMIDCTTLPTIRSTMVKALMDVSKEFASRSVSAYRSTQQQTVQDSKESDCLSVNKPAPAKDLATAATDRVQSMIRWDDSNHLIFVFHNQNIHTLTPLYRDKSKVPTHIKQLFEGQMKRSLPDLGSLNQESLQDILQKIARRQQPLAPKKLQVLAAQYALTPDNLLKMVLIMLRIKAQIPIIIMGETGCGKTSLIRYMASICEIPFDVISIHAGVEETTLIERIHENNKLARSAMSSERWVFFDEINTSEHIGLLSEVVCHHRCIGTYLSQNLVFMAACNPYKLRSKDAIFTSGLKSKVKTDELSRLVYRVYPLPEMLVDYVWDFGSLSENDEILYIERMVSDLLKLPCNRSLFVELLAMSQTYTRTVSGTTSCVSLRDVQRCKTLLTWFLDVASNKNRKRSYTPYKDHEISAIILTLAHCYQSRYAKNKQRRTYRANMHKIFNKYDHVELTTERIHGIITQEQKDILARMELPPGTALNVALQENIFVLLVCILTRIPIFLVGKPGCSKSLSMQVIKSNLRGKDSVDEFFKTLPQLYCVSFQGSESSTSDGIIKVFEKAENYQKVNNNDDVLSVVLLDEIGLAEVSKFNPLKVLHNLLEPDGLSRPNVAVVGISNWCLDESKMNRAVHLSRPEMDIEELHETAISISESFESKKVSILDQGDAAHHFKAEDIKNELLEVADSYVTYIREMRFENFHGLRDYYSLVKYFTRELSLMNTRPNEEEFRENVARGIQRNFGGLPDEQGTLMKAFGIHSCRNIPVLELIKENLEDKMARHLMLITTGESITGILECELDAVGRTKREILFGSQYEEDLTDDYNYRILSRIILCMEQGMVLILQDLENIYGSLYDMLNKNYTEIGKKKLCRVALGAYSNPFCHVHESFKCIVLVNKKYIKYSDPPFLNRFEKHYLQFSDIISDNQRKIIAMLKLWIQKLISMASFTEEVCFPIYSHDMLASLVLKIDRNDSSAPDDTFEKCKNELLWIIQPEVIIRSLKQHNELSEQQFYFALPVHSGLCNLLEYQLNDEHDMQLGDGLVTIVFTNSNVHSKSVRDVTVRPHTIQNIGAFKSEKQMSLAMRRFWIETEEEIMFLLCNAGHEKHILLAKSTIERYRKEFLLKPHEYAKHVYFIIHVDRNVSDTNISSAISYLSEWKLVLLDSIDPPSITVPQLCKMSLLESIKLKRPLNEHLKGQFLWSFTRIKYPKLGRTVESFTKLLESMKQSKEFADILEELIFLWIQKYNAKINDVTWSVEVACDTQALKSSSTCIGALEKYILDVINIPLSKFMFKMENANILDCFFIEDNHTLERRVTWRDLICREDVFSINAVPDETGPETYVCDHNEIFLKLPFSMHIYRTIEATKEEFMHSVAVLRGKIDLDDDDDLPEELLVLLLYQHQSLILQKIPDFADYVYKNGDYIHDFCSLISYTACSSLDQEKRVRCMIFILQEIIGKSFTNSLELFTRLHTYVWMEYHHIYASMQLLDFCLSDNGLDKKSMAYVENMLVEIVSSMHQFDNGLKDDSFLGKYSSDQILLEASSCTDAGCENDSEASADMKSLEKSAVDVSILTGESASITDEKETSNKQNLRCKLVEVICENMLPVEAAFLSHEDLLKWKRKAHTILTLSSNVSLSPQRLHDLRFCYDLSAELIIPHELATDWLTKMAELVRSHTLDSPEILESYMHMVLSVSVMARGSCFKMLSRILVNCMCRDLSTDTVHLLYSWIRANMIPDECVWMFYATVRLAMKLEAAKYPDIFLNILHDEHNIHIDDSTSSCKQSPVDEEFLGTSNDEETMSNENEIKARDMDELNRSLIKTVDGDESNVEVVKAFSEHAKKEGYIGTCHIGYCDTLTWLDDCITHLMKTSEECRFITMVTDILHEIYQEKANDDRESCNEDEASVRENELTTFLECHRAIDEATGLKQVAASAYCKYFLGSISTTLFNTDMHVETKQVLKSIFKPESKNGSQAVLAKYLIKLLGRDLPLVVFTKYNLKYLRDTFDELDLVEWLDNSILHGFEYCPLLNFIPLYFSDINDIFKIQEGQQMHDKLGQFVNQHKSSENGYLALFSVALRHFYLKRPDHDTTDTELHHATSFLEEAEKQAIVEPAIQLLKCLSGKKDFVVGEFMIDGESEPLECIISSWMTSFYSLLLANQSFRDDNPMPILVRCLMRPLSVKAAFLPGFPDPQEESDEIVVKCGVADETRLMTCECGHRLALFKKDFNICPVCREELTFLSSDKCHLKDPITCRGYVNTNVSCSGKIRHLTPVSQHILCLMIKGCLLGSVALGLSTFEDLEQVTSMEELDVSAKLWNDITMHWKMLSELLNTDANTILLVLHSVLLNTKELFCENDAQMVDVEERHNWELEFEKSTSNNLSCPLGVVQQMLHTYYDKVQPESKAELYLRELENVQVTSENARTMQVERLFRLTGRSNMMNFIQKVFERSESYPFLALVIENKSYLDLPRHMLPLIQWHVTVVSHVNFLFKKRELLQLSIEEFIRRYDKKDNLIKKRFKCFMETWNEIRKKFAWLKLKPELARVNYQTSIADCLVLDKESVVYHVLQVLLQVQNGFIDSALYCSQYSESVGFLKRDDNTAVVSKVEITEINKQHLIDLHFNLDDIIEQDSQCDLSYNLGRHISYDLKGIEKELAVSFLVGKAYIGFRGSLPSIGFTDELYKNYVSLVNDIKDSVDQFNFPHSLLSSVYTNHQSDPKMATELLTYLGMVMTWLKKTKGNPHMSLIEYIEKWQEIFTDSFPKHLLPSPHNSLLLCHVVAFHEILEELSAESIIHSLTDEFRLELEFQWECSLKDLVKDQRKAAETFLKTLKRFTYRCLSMRDAEPGTSLLSHLQDLSFWPEHAVTSDGVRGKEDVIIPMEQVVPSGLTVGHIFYTIVTIEKEFEDIRRDDMKINKIASSYQSQKKTTKDIQDKRTKKLLKGFQKRV